MSGDADGSTADAAAEFHRAMVDLYQNAKRQAGYNASYFLRAVSERGGLATAHTLLAAGKTSDGFTALYERKRLDLTVEALVLQPRWSSLFSEEELETARERLELHGHTPAPVETDEPPAPVAPPQEPPFPAARASTASAAEWDFFVSYTKPDSEWAEWIAWQLEDAGYRVLFQEWDFVPGVHWTERMGEGIRDASRTLAVLSNSYLRSVYGRNEWHAAYRADPRGFTRKLIPVRIEDCDRPDLLGEVVSFDLFDMSPEQARARLLAQIDSALTGRAKPSSEPRFPTAATGRTTAPSAPRPFRAETAHTGKYRALWAWLRDQPADALPMTFGEIEAVLGMPLPPSSRKHPAHWSGYDNSAVSRAIRDAGWKATKVDLRGETLVFVRDRPQR